MQIDLKFISTKVDYQNDVLRFCEEYNMGFENYKLRTSGSTGEPKLITFSKLQMRDSALATIEKLQLSSDFKALVCLNINYIAGKMMLVRCIEAQMDAVIIEPTSFPFDQIPDDINIDFAAFVPLQLNQMFERNKKEDIDRLNKIKIILIGGETISEQLTKKLKALESEVYHTFGMTETLSHFALKNITRGENHFELLKQVDIGLNKNDCLRIKSNVTNNIWIQTNDIVKLIIENNKTTGFEWVGRIDEVINSGGIKIQSSLLESEIAKAFQILDIKNRYFIYKEPDKKLSEKVVLFIEGHPFHISLQKKILSEIKNMIENKYWVPKKIVFISQFILTKTGKIDKISSIKQF